MLTRSRWIDEAYASVRRQPDATIAINGVAELLGTTKGSFYHHFTSRGDLVLEILSKHERDTEATIRRAGQIDDPRDAMWSFLADAFTDTSYMNVEGFLMEEELVDTEVEKLGMRAGRAVNVWIQATLVRSGATPQSAARVLVLLRSTYEGVVLSRRFHQRTWLQHDLEELAATLWSSVQSVIGDSA